MKQQQQRPIKTKKQIYEWIRQQQLRKHKQ
jgi:hypothetical protein